MRAGSEVALGVVAVVAEELVCLGVSVLDDEFPSLAVVLSSLLVPPSVDVVDCEECKVALSATDTFPSISFVNLVLPLSRPFPVALLSSCAVFLPPLRLVLGRTGFAVSSPRFSSRVLPASWTDVVVSPLHTPIISHPSPLCKVSPMPLSSSSPRLRPA